MDDRAMQHLPLARDTPREDHRVLVLWWYHDPDVLDGVEVLCGREVDAGAGGAVGGAGDDIAAEFVEKGEPGIFETPFTRHVVGVGGEKRRLIERPFGDAICGTGDVDRRHSSPVFDA